MKDFPAILGGSPVFDAKLPIVRPMLPPYSELAEGFDRIISSGMVTKGPYLQEFEEAVAEHLGVRHAVAVSSCTTGLVLAYRALGLTGDVIVPSFTFMATVSSLVVAGLRPVFADVDRETQNVDPASVRQMISPDTSAIVAVHNFGNPADIRALQEIADSHGLKLVFDAAHGFGTLYNGRPVGSSGAASVYSLSPTKLLIAGEGGIVATDDDKVAEMVRIGREYGNDGSYNSLFAGINARMPEFCALLGLHGLPGLEEAVANRAALADLYRRELGAIPGLGFQHVRPEDRSSHKDFSFTVAKEKSGLSRDQLAEALNRENIDVRRYYDPPAHRHLAYEAYAGGCRLPETDWLSENVICIPIWSHMTRETALKVCEGVRRIFTHSEQVASSLTASEAAAPASLRGHEKS